MPLKIEALPTELVQSLQGGEPDSYGNLPEQKTSDGVGVPCRHCLEIVEEGKAYLVVAHRPFASLQPYAETGPIFIHADACERADPNIHLPEMLSSESYIVRGYDADERIVYGTGGVVPTENIPAVSESLLKLNDVEFVHVRSAQNNCFQYRIEQD